jgi:hypothetical protein
MQQQHDPSAAGAKASAWLQQLLLLVLTTLWLKLAYDVVFNFGPESARFWFPLRAVIAVCSISLVFSALNVFLLVHPDDCRPSSMLTKPRKALIAVAFLGSIFSCWLDETVAKALDIYLVIPAIILLLILSAEANARRATHYVMLGLSIFLLIPNDKCANPQNWWWINHVGASPMTYAAPVNALLCLTTRAGNRPSVRIVCTTVVVLYYVACVYHCCFGGY